MITSSLPWAAQSTRDKAVVVDLANRLVAHPRFAELKAMVDKAWRRAVRNTAFESDHEQVDNYLNAAIVEKKPAAVALQTLIASDLGVSLKPCVGLFGGRYLDIPEPSAVAA